MTEIITPDGEVVEMAAGTALALAAQGDGLAFGLARVEIDARIATARAFPRQITVAAKRILTLATLDEETSAECMYALPRGGKPIKGPSVRLAEIIQQSWGNNAVDARVLHVDRTEKVVIAEGSYIDLETNAGTRATIQRRIVDRNGRLFSDDMIITTGNAACSIARRNAILAGVPKGVWRKAYQDAERVVAGDQTTLVVRRENAIKAFAAFGVKPEMVFAALAVPGLEDIGLDRMPELIGMYHALKNGEETVESMFAPRTAAAAKTFVKVEDPLGTGKKKEATAAEAKPAESEKAAEGAAAAVAQSGAQAGEAAPAGTATPEEISPARQKGREARAKGVGRKAVPGELRGKPEEAEWVKGWEETPAPAPAATSKAGG